MTSTRRADQPQAGQDRGSFTEDLRQVLRVEVLRDFCSAAMVAPLFSMHRRTLYRHLQAEGCTFKQMTDEVRFKIACDLLETTNMAIGQVAAVLKYSDASAFTRVFRRWSGQPPSAWRSSHRR